jgi:chromatin assembly factor 1 subunit B
MRFVFPEISFHEKSPVLSLHFHPFLHHTFVTGGSDHAVRIWQVLSSNPFRLEVRANLIGHVKTVNSVRFSPCGTYVASTGDDGYILVWCRSEIPTKPVFGSDTNLLDVPENWVISRKFSTFGEIQDLAWTPKSAYLISVSIDHRMMLRSLSQGSLCQTLEEHDHYIQGISCDPLGQYVISQSSDRSLRIYRFRCKQEDLKFAFAVKHYVPSDIFSGPKKLLFLDDSIQTFFRRGSFSPDGSLFVAPTGQVVVEKDLVKKKQTTMVSWMFHRENLSQPILRLPAFTATMVVRFSPLRYALRKSKSEPDNKSDVGLGLSYRMIFAVVCFKHIYFYDTEQLPPIGIVKNAHILSPTDAAWSSNGLLFSVSSCEGYCSFVIFDPGELGDAMETELDPIALPTEKHIFRNTTNVKKRKTKANASFGKDQPRWKKKAKPSKKIACHGNAGGRATFARPNFS